jgi:hypothetical protein
MSVQFRIIEFRENQLGGERDVTWGQIDEQAWGNYCRALNIFFSKRTKKQGKCMQYWAIDLSKCSLLNIEGASSSETVKQTRYITQFKDLEDHHFCNIRREN